MRARRHCDPRSPGLSAMPATTGGYTSASLAAQAAEVEFDAFPLDSAVALGRLATDRALAGGLGLVIEVHHLGRVVFRAALPGSRADSDDWIVRKSRVVERFGASTMAVRVGYEEQGTTFEESTGLPPSQFAAHGGGFPIVVTDVGAVGACYASGLPQEQDHEFLVACLRELKSRGRPVP